MQAISVAKSIRSMREEYDLTQEELAKRSGISKVMIYYIESGKRNPSLTVAKKLADALHCTIEDLII